MQKSFCITLSAELRGSAPVRFTHFGAVCVTTILRARDNFIPGAGDDAGRVRRYIFPREAMEHSLSTDIGKDS
jgi:hypothetical protein